MMFLPAIDLKNMQYRFKNKGIFELMQRNWELIEPRNDDPKFERICGIMNMTWIGKWDLINDRFDYNDSISNIINLDNLIIRKCNNIQSVCEFNECIRKNFKR